MLNSFTLAPVMMQWVVYAVRNLTEDNSQNQDVIAKMEEQGLADASLLKKMGFEIEKSGDKLILKSNNDIPPPVSTLCKLSSVPPRKLPLHLCDLEVRGLSREHGRLEKLPSDTVTDRAE